VADSLRQPPGNNASTLTTEVVTLYGDNEWAKRSGRQRVELS
jgi:hypothetical protein